jgi:hypothetical protein
LFSTVTTTQLHLEALGNNSIFALEQWNELIVSGYERSEVLVEVEQEGLPLPQLENEWLSPAEIEERENLRARRAAQRRLARSEMTQERTPENTDTDGQIIPGPIVQPVPVTVQFPQNEEPERQDMQPAQPVPNVENTSTVQTELRVDPQPTIRTGGRRIRTNRRFIGEEWVNYQTSCLYNKKKQKSKSSILNFAFLQSLDWKKTIEKLTLNDLITFLSQLDFHTYHNAMTVEWQHPMELSAWANAKDNPTWEDAMSGPDKAGYWKAMEKEYHTLEQDMDSWKVIEKEEWMNILPGFSV